MPTSPACKSLKLITAVLLVAQSGFPAVLAAQQMQDGDLKAPAKPAVAKPISKDEKLLMVLDRFTYGPRPGDLQKIRTLGVNGWFAQQLDPKSIDDSAMDARLAKYPAMQLPLEKLMEAYPDNQMVRQSMNGNLSVPGGDAERAIYADQQERYKEKLNKDKKTKSADADKMVKGGDGEDQTTAPLPMPVAELLALPADQILAMAPDARFKFILEPEPRADARAASRKCFMPSSARYRCADRRFHRQSRWRSIASRSAGPSQADRIRGQCRRSCCAISIQREAVAGGDGRLLAQSLQRVHEEERSRHLTYISCVRARCDSAVCAGARFQDLLIWRRRQSPAMLELSGPDSESIGPHSECRRMQPVRFGGKEAERPCGLNENYAREVMELHTVGVEWRLYPEGRYGAGEGVYRLDGGERISHKGEPTAVQVEYNPQQA